MHLKLFNHTVLLQQKNTFYISPKENKLVQENKNTFIHNEKIFGLKYFLVFPFSVKLV